MNARVVTARIIARYPSLTNPAQELRDTVGMADIDHRHYVQVTVGFDTRKSHATASMRTSAARTSPSFPSI